MSIFNGHEYDPERFYEENGNLLCFHHSVEAQWVDDLEGAKVIFGSDAGGYWTCPVCSQDVDNELPPYWYS